eukprot:g6287.t1
MCVHSFVRDLMLALDLMIHFGDCDALHGLQFLIIATAIYSKSSAENTEHLSTSVSNLLYTGDGEYSDQVNSNLVSITPHKCCHRVGTLKKPNHNSEFSSDISEYIVELKAPLGLALAPDLRGQIYVAQVEHESPAEEHNIMMGDVLKQCTCAFNADETCSYDDLRKVQWAINKHKDAVRLVLKRQQLIGCGRWFRSGLTGCVSTASSWLLTPVHFPSKHLGEWTNKREGKSFVLSFHRAILDDLSSRDQRRSKITAELKSRLLDALQLPTLVLPAYSLVNQTGAGSNEEEQELCCADLLDEASGFEQTRVEEQLNAKKASLIPILPWLQVTTARLTHADILELASQCALQRLLELTLYPCKNGVTLAGMSCGLQTPVLGTITAAATLHRLVLRRRVILQDRVKNCNVLLHCEEGMSSAVATLLAAYYHWYGMLQMDESISLAELALFAPVCKSLLLEMSNFLHSTAQEREESVTVSWPYGGTHVQIAGELVGGWDKRATLQKSPSEFSPCFDIPTGVHYLRLKNLLPGIYHYKFIVDNRWAIDRLSPRDSDHSGNLNNVLYIEEMEESEVQASRLDLYRLSAALVSLRIKGAKS